MKNYVIVIFFILAIIENGRAIDYSFIDVGLGRVQTFDISPDEKILAMGSNSGIIALYDIEKSKYLKIFAPQPFSAIFSLEFDATGKYLASSGTDKKMRVWDIEGDSLLKQIKLSEGTVLATSWHPSGRYLAGGADDGYFAVWDIIKNKLVSMYCLNDHRTQDVYDIEFSPKGDYLALVSRTDYLYVHYFNGIVDWGYYIMYSDHPDPLSVSWSSDGSMVASGGSDATVKVFNYKKQETIRKMWGHGTVKSIQWINDDTKIAFGNSKGAIEVFLMDSSKFDYQLNAHTKYIQKIKWLKNKRILVSLSDDLTMKYWDLEARKMIKDFKCVKHSYTKLFFNPGDSTLYALSNQPDDVNKIFYWKINDSIKSNSINNTKSISNFTISEHSKYLATYSTDSVLKVYNLLTKDLLYSQNLPKMPQQISFSPDEEVLAIGWNSFIRFLSAKTGDYDTTIYTQKPKISSLKWKPNSKILSYTGFDDDFVLWDMDLRQTILNQSMYNSKITSVDWSQDGKFVALGADAGNLIIWNSENNQVYTGFQFDTSISEVKWHPLENKLAIIQKNKPIKFWDMTSEKVTDTISPLYSNISSFAWGLGDESIYYADDIGVIVNTNIKNISTTDDLILSKSDLKIYPNPTSSILFFNYSLETNSHVIITIVDALGNEAYQKDLGFVDKGENSYFLDTDNMAQGFYFIRVQKNGISEIGKFGVIR